MALLSGLFKLDTTLDYVAYGLAAAYALVALIAAIQILRLCFRPKSPTQALFLTLTFLFCASKLLHPAIFFLSFVLSLGW